MLAVVALSRRRAGQLASYASLELGGRKSQVIRDKYGAKRCAAVNVTNGPTVELRLFRGTLRPASLLGYIQIASAAVTYAAQCPIPAARALSFFRWVVENRKTYSAAAHMIRRRVVELRDDAPEGGN